ncbi:hypothetical protein G6514_007064 [Epicoccum nigrum]|nr:hypothetical protein G6514_007064 [Epicoccum nigrum]
MKLTVVKSQSMKETSYGRVKVVSDVAIAKKLRSPTTTAVSSSLATNPITVVVGPEGEKIYVHEAILSSSSAYLKDAFKPEWQKPGEKQIELRDVDIAQFPHLHADQADYSAEFLVDVVKAGLRRNTGVSMGVQAFFMPKDTCVYHEHTLTNTPCYKIAHEHEAPHIKSISNIGLGITKSPKAKEKEKERPSSEAVTDRVQTGHVEKKLHFPFKRRFLSFHRPPVVVAVGGYTFHVHENVLVASSILLQDALNSRSEGSTEQIVLPNLARCGLLFGKYIYWLYSGRLCLEPSIEWKPCYRIAEELQDCTFKDAIIDIHIEKIVAEDDYPLLGHVIYQYTDRGSPHGKLALDVAINF